MARDAIAFLAAMEFGQADVLGFFIGSFVAQDIALIRPGVLRRLILASSAPQGAAGMHGWVADVIDAVGGPEVDPERVLDVFNTRSPSSRHTGEQAFQRMYARTQDWDQPTTWTTRQARYDVVCAWGDPRSCPAAAAVRHQPAGVRGQRRQRPDDPATGWSSRTGGGCSRRS
jgi:pimeloyl-ACP methyl ester carboxylesterase